MDLITGATGFIGSHVLYRLLKSGREVRALYRDQVKMEVTRKVIGYYESNPEEIVSKVLWVKGDLMDMQALTEYMEGVTNVFHAAGLVSYSSADRRLLNTVNIRGTANMVNACLEAGGKKLIHLSSVATLGNNTGVMTDEKSMWKHGSFKSDYSVSKYRGELEVWRGINEGLDAVIVNPSVVTGPGMWLGEAGKLFAGISRGLKYYPVGGAGYVDVRDVADIMVKLSETSITGERFILNSENMLHREVINLIAENLGKTRPEIALTPFISFSACILENLLSKITGRKPRITLDGIKTANDTTTYNNNKIIKELNYNFITVKESIDFSTNIYIKEIA